MLRYGCVIALCVAASISGCDRDRGGDDFALDGGDAGRDAGTPGAGRGGSRADAGPLAGRMAGGNGGSAVGGRGGAGAAGSGTAGGTAGAFPAGTTAPDPKIDCSVDNGDCGDAKYIQCISSPSGGYCLDLNECIVDNGGCDRLSYCYNMYAGPPTCSPCPYGYTGNPTDGCTDIDECENNNGGCGDPEHTQCMNYDGSYNCQDLEECTTDNGGCGDPAEYWCVEQFNAAPTCILNECFANNGGCGSADTARCVDRPDITAFCVGKVSAVIASDLTCVLRADQAVDCLSVELQGGVHRLANRYAKISSTQQFLCGIEAAGSVHCEAGHPELQSEPSGTNFTAIATGYYHACALRTDGTAACWGADQGGSVSRPHFESSLRSIAANMVATCVVRTAGTLECFGAEEPGGAITAANADESTDFVAVYMGPENVCGLHMDGTADCWGNNSYGQLTGIMQAGSATYSSLAMSEGTICGLRTDGTVRCWGFDEYGQASGPNSAPGGVAQVSAGPGRTCLVWSDGTFRCYGVGAEGPNTDPWARPAE